MDRPRPTIPAVATPSGGCCGGRRPCLPGAAPAAPPPAASSSAAAAAASVLVTAGGATYTLDLAYWLGIRASVASKRPLTLKTVVQVIRSLDGRDKVTKTIQYACRYLWWYHSRQADAFSKERGAQFEKMFRASQTARKCFHLFRTLEELEKVQALMGDQKTPEWRRRALLVRAAAMAIYWFYDNICFFINVKLSNYDPVKALTRDGAAWTLANGISIWLALHDLNAHSHERARLEARLAALIQARGGAATAITTASDNVPTATAIAGPAAPSPTAAAASAITGKNGQDGSGPHHNHDAVAVPGESTAAPAPGPPQQEPSQPSSSSGAVGAAGAGPAAAMHVVVTEAEVADALEAIAAADCKQFDLLGDLVRSACDFTVACNSTGFDLPKRLLGYKLHDGIIGVAGLISAISAVYKTYPTNPTPPPRALLAPGKKMA